MLVFEIFDSDLVVFVDGGAVSVLSCWGGEVFDGLEDRSGWWVEVWCQASLEVTIVVFEGEVGELKEAEDLVWNDDALLLNPFVELLFHI